MKNTYKSLTLAVLVLIASCSKDENTSEGTPEDQAIEEMENTPLEVNAIADNVIIAGSTKNDGTPPTPNEAISLDISNSSTIALLNEGFEVSLQSDGSITGAYLQFKANDGTVSNSYYDIDLNSNAGAKQVFNSHRTKRKFSSPVSKNDDDTTVDVDFNANIEPGTFCYVICVYDDEGNISAPQEVCVTVEAWGGNSEIAGTWNLIREEELEEGEIVFELEAGVEFCSPESLFCENQETLEYDSCSTSDYGKLIFNADGTFESDFSNTYTGLNVELSLQQCEAIFGEDEVFVTTSEGFWAYSEEESQLVLVLYSLTYTTVGGGTQTETFEEGSAGSLFQGTIEVNGNILEAIEEGSDSDGDGIDEYIFRSVFEKE